jgi:hypothetical protein
MNTFGSGLGKKSKSDGIQIPNTDGEIIIIVTTLICFYI